MAQLFKAANGSVFVESVTGPQYMSVSGVGAFDRGSIILTGVQVSRKESLHHIKVMSSKVYTYAFGELPGGITVSGMIFFLSSCNISAGSLGKVNGYYERQRAYSRGAPAYIGIGGASFKVALSSLDMSAEAGPFPVGKFTLGFSIIPSDSGGGSS